MTKLYGAIVGAANQATGSPQINPAYRNGRVARIAKDYAEFTTDLAQDDTVHLGMFSWDTIIDEHSLINFDDFGTSVTLDVGDVTYPAALVDGQDVATAAGSCGLLKSVDIANRHKPLWQMLGYADKAAALLIGQRCELLASFKDANPGAGTLTWTIYGSPQ